MCEVCFCWCVLVWWGGGGGGLRLIIKSSASTVHSKKEDRTFASNGTRTHDVRLKMHHTPPSQCFHLQHLRNCHCKVTSRSINSLFQNHWRCGLRPWLFIFVYKIVLISIPLSQKKRGAGGRGGGEKCADLLPVCQS